jgi:hypothetical protein
MLWRTTLSVAAWASVKAAVIMLLAGAVVLILRRRRYAGSNATSGVARGAGGSRWRMPVLAMMLPAWPLARIRRTHATPSASDRGSRRFVDPGGETQRRLGRDEMGRRPCRGISAGGRRGGRLSDAIRAPNWREWILIAWLAGAAVAVAPWLLGVIQIRRLTRRATRLDGGFWPLLGPRRPGRAGDHRATCRSCAATPATAWSCR